VAARPTSGTPSTLSGEPHDPCRCRAARRGDRPDLVGPRPPKTASSSVCILIHGNVIAELAGDNMTLKTLSPGTGLRRYP
jgi:hypothetical protein